MRNSTKSKYFVWLLSLVCNDYEKKYYGRLLEELHNIRFVWDAKIPRDEYRASDGKRLRETFSDIENLPSSQRYMLNEMGDCSVLEMMIGLADRCETTIMGDDPLNPNVSRWFWGMIESMGLNCMDDGRFDLMFIERTVDIMMYREYSPDGEGGLFRIENCPKDLRKMEIWAQMCWYLDSMNDN